MTNLSEIKERCELATPGPWENSTGFVRSAAGGNKYEVAEGFTVSTSCKWVAECRNGEAFYDWEANSDFIAHARTDIPFLLSALAAATERAEKAEVAEQKAFDAGYDWRVGFTERWAGTATEHMIAGFDFYTENLRFRSAGEGTGE